MIFLELDEKFRDLVPNEILQEAAIKTLLCDYPEDQPALTVKITDDQKILELNTIYRGIEKVTDVLSFEADYFDPDLDSRYLGDVVISYPQAVNQAEKRGHSVESELQLLAIHGVLHLMGYDHGSPEDKEQMWLLQNQILDQLGLEITVEDEETK